MCVTVQKKYIPFMLLTAYRAAGLRVNMLKDNIENDIKEMALLFTRTENNFINTTSQYRHFRSRYLVETVTVFPSWSSSEKRLCTYTLCYRLLVLSYATPTPRRLTFLSSHSKELEPLIKNNTTKTLLFSLHRHKQLNTECREGEIGK